MPELSANTKKIDYLTEDKPIAGQNFVCLSFVSPEGIKNCSLRAIKVRGVFNTYEQAQEYCKELQQIDSDFDIFIGEMGKWLPWNPDPLDDEKCKDQHYSEKPLQDLVQGYKENRQKTKKLEEERKKEFLEKAMEEEQQRTESKSSNVKDRLRKKLDERKKLQEKSSKPEDFKEKSKPEDFKEKSEDFKKREEELKIKEQHLLQEKEPLVMEQKAVQDKMENLESVEQRLEKIKQLYSKLNKPTN